jgi:integrase
VAAYLARFKGSSREHTESDLRCYLAWCAEQSLDPLAARRPHLELHIRWMQEIRRFKPSTVSRRFSVTAGFYRTCVLDSILEPSPAEHDFALVAILGLLGLRIFEATGADIADLGEEHGHRVLRVCGKGTKVVLVPLPPTVSRAIDQAAGSRPRGPILLNRRGARMDRHAATRRLHQLAEAAGIQVARAHPHMLRHSFVTTSSEDGIPEILAEQRLGHDLPGDARPVRPRLASDAGRSDRRPPGPLGKNRCGSEPASTRAPPSSCLTTCSRRSGPARRRRSPKFLPERQQLPSSAQDESCQRSV